MPIFVSYSRRDSDFATRLAAQLVKHNARVWIDQWELRVGDSILDRIQSAIAGASALLVVLSKASVESEWCKKELSSGLLRELEEKRVVVLPVLIEDCEIPLFLRGKLYADFRTDFDQGLSSVLEAIARVTSESLGRIEEPEWHSDWAIDWGMLGEFFSIRVTIVEQAADQPFTALTELRIVANDIATRRYLEFQKYDLGWLERSAIIQMLVDVTQERDLRLILEDETAKAMEIGMGDPRLGILHHVTITARRLGEDTGKNILLNLGAQLRQIGEMQKRASRPLKTEDLAILKTIQKSFDPD